MTIHQILMIFLPIFCLSLTLFTLRNSSGPIYLNITVVLACTGQRMIPASLPFCLNPLSPLLHPSPLPSHLWSHIHLEFITCCHHQIIKQQFQPSRLLCFSVLHILMPYLKFPLLKTPFSGTCWLLTCIPTRYASLYLETQKNSKYADWKHINFANTPIYPMRCFFLTIQKWYFFHKSAEEALFCIYRLHDDSNRHIRFCVWTGSFWAWCSML